MSKNLSQSAEQRRSIQAAPDHAHGPWANYQLPEDRSTWHPHCRQLLDYWSKISPSGRLPGRQHLSPEQIAPLLPRLWMLDVVRNPLRFRYRLVGTAEVSTLGRETTGQWVDEAHPEFLTDPVLHGRYRYMVDTCQPTWRRGPVRWQHDNMHRTVENCMVPLAADGRTIDIIVALSVLFDADGREIRA